MCRRWRKRSPFCETNRSLSSSSTETVAWHVWDELREMLAQPYGVVAETG